MLEELKGRGVVYLEGVLLPVGFPYPRELENALYGKHCMLPSYPHNPHGFLFVFLALFKVNVFKTKRRKIESSKDLLSYIQLCNVVK